MFVLHVEMTIKPGKEGDMDETFHNIFKPAISAQSGFDGVSLLKPVEDGAAHRMSIAFDSRDSQQRWVKMDLHQEVWPLILSHVDHYSVNYYQGV
jgi:heme-degrading monooxygenase HmoA